MINKNKAINIVENLISHHKVLNLCISFDTACWKQPQRNITEQEWMDIGRISALVFAFNIKEKDLK
jgi:hypothetical protein